MYYLGIDSGGTKAAFLLGDETGRIYARHQANGCTVLADGKEGVYRMVRDGVAAICEKAGITPDDIACLGLGISGYGEVRDASSKTYASGELRIFFTCAFGIATDHRGKQYGIQSSMGDMKLSA